MPPQKRKSGAQSQTSKKRKVQADAPPKKSKGVVVTEDKCESDRGRQKAGTSSKKKTYTKLVRKDTGAKDMVGCHWQISLDVVHDTCLVTSFIDIL